MKKLILAVALTAAMPAAANPLCNDVKTWATDAMTLYYRGVSLNDVLRKVDAMGDQSRQGQRNREIASAVVEGAYRMEADRNVGRQGMTAMYANGLYLQCMSEGWK